MAYTLEAFCNDIKRTLKADDSPKSRKAICGMLQELLLNKEFVAKTLGPHVEEGRHTLYEDPELKFCVLAHIDRESRHSAPHDHGRSWAIYGQAIGWSEMGIWKRTDGGTGPGVAKVEEVKRYRIEPGQAGVFDIGDIHSVDRSEGGCCYVRVTGVDLEKLQRLKYDVAKGRAIIVESAGVGPA